MEFYAARIQIIREAEILADRVNTGAINASSVEGLLDSQAERLGDFDEARRRLLAAGLARFKDLARAPAVR